MSRKLVALFIFLVSGINLSQAASEQVTDIRVLVDVSGSMAKTDPNNLRRPALRLLFGLSPEDARVGMWSFAKFTNNQLKPAYATSQWKKQARKVADSVHSLGQRTNIEDVLRRSTWDWKRPNPKWSRHMILLTDGMVDVSRDKKLNQASRQRILNEILPELQAGGVKIHSVALSENADHELLKTLSRKTDGWYERVDDSEGLQRVFLRMFEKASPGDTLPLKENNFSVDKSITDMTLLVFRGKDAKPTRIKQPDGTVFDEKQHSENVEWHKETGYDIITVKKPVTGNWTILADVDPDNRVRVLTNLRLVTASLPNNLLFGEKFTLHAQLQEQGKSVTDKDFLDVVEFSAEIKNTDHDYESRYTLDSQDDIKPGKGIYSKEVDNLEEPGSHEITVVARSETFVRSKRHTVKIHAFPLKTSVTENEDGLGIKVEIIPGIIRQESVQLGIILPGSSAPHQLERLDENNWVYKTDRHYPGETANLMVNAVLEDDKAYENLVPIQLPGEKQIIAIQPINKFTVPEAEIPEVVEATTEPEDVEEKTEDDTSKEEETDDAAETPAEDREEDKGTNWWLIGSILVFVNLLVIAGGYFAYRKWVKGGNIEVDLGDEDDDGNDTSGAETTVAEKEESQPEKQAEPAPLMDDADPEVSENVADALEQMASEDKSSDEDFSEMRREETEMEPVILDEEDIPEFDMDEANGEETADGADTTDEEDEFAKATAAQLAEESDDSATETDAEDEFAKATAAQLAEESDDSATETDAEDEFAKATAAQLAEESDDSATETDAEDECAKATAAPIAEESADSGSETDAEDEFAKATAEQLAEEQAGDDSDPDDEFARAVAEQLGSDDNPEDKKD